MPLIKAVQISAYSQVFLGQKGFKRGERGQFEQWKESEYLCVAKDDYLNSKLSCLGQWLWFQYFIHLYLRSSLVMWGRNNGYKHLSRLCLLKACLPAFFLATYGHFHLNQVPRAGREVDPGDIWDPYLREHSDWGVRKRPKMTVQTTKEWAQAGWDTGHGFDFLFDPGLLKKKKLKKSKLGVREGGV